MKEGDAFLGEGWTPDRLGDLRSKTFLVTGASSGTGYEAAKKLLASGAHVVMLNRNEAKTLECIKTLRKELGEDIEVTFIAMDLADLSSVRGAAAEVKKQVEKIDALICNAAIAQVARRELTVDGFESQLGTNYYGNFLLINLLFGKVQESGGRIVVVSSIGYKLGKKKILFDDMSFEKGYDPNDAYSQSKLALMMFVYELQRRLKKKGVSTEALVCHPGSASTSLINQSAPYLTRCLWYIISSLPIVQTAEQGAFSQLMCATEPNLEQAAFYGPTGSLEFCGPVGRGTLEEFVFDEAVALQLWDVSTKATNSDWDFLK